MATHPAIAAKVRTELDIANANGPAPPVEISRLPYLNATIKEAMRLYPPSTQLFTRVALRDVQIGSTLVPKGTLVAIPIWHLHHDARWFPDPDLFRPERFMPGAPSVPRGAYLPFGAGPHFCLGQHFATVEIALVAARLLQRFDLAMVDAALPEPVVDLVLKPKSRLLVGFARRG